MRAEEHGNVRRSNSGKSYRGPNHGTGDGYAEDEDEDRCVDGDLATVEFAKVSREGEDAVAGYGECDALESRMVLLDIFDLVFLEIL